MVDAPRRLARFAGGAVVAVAALTSASVAQAAPADVNPFIVGGQDANIADHPFTVALTTPDGQQFCGGSLVAENKVLTAAHCTDGQQAADIKVVSGRTTMSSSEGTVSDVTDVWIHPEYTDATKGFDVSVLTLGAPVQEAPIELATADDPSYAPDTEATILGWGNTSEGGQQSDHLQKAAVPVSSDETCSQAYPEYSNESMVCAGLPEGGVDSCQGDSGGPMVAGGRLIGVVSWGQGCAQAGFPGVYARVGAYNDVITEQINS
ncbi:serine protease [Saccharopolyspora rhizosphaerae]|uniref:Serine protease n=1 Tax=Saccharopolyspora rhizosphaerae TaxID=2492662 RepID=A0A3R8P3G7_9PSEU|nr:serine protease [Saccharopolyspora rhizosphaerae]RRO15720.1 serine protease [Saccharopolyspora rhizosphaerae]